jgi:hypothetical protein
MEKRPKRSTTMRRHELVFINYLRVLKRLGADAKNVSKIALYDEAGQPLGLDAMTSGRIIRAALKKNMVSDINYIEAEGALDVLLKLNE